jgi:hypothetical protein
MINRTEAESAAREGLEQIFIATGWPPAVWAPMFEEMVKTISASIMDGTIKLDENGRMSTKFLGGTSTGPDPRKN